MTFISKAEDNKALSLTIYQNNFGMIKEKRELNLSKLEDTIFFLNVPEKIEVDSIMFENLDVYEVNYDFNTINKRNLLESYIGKEVIIHDYQLDKKINGILLNSDNGYIIQENKSKEIYLIEKGQLIFHDLPNKFLLKPTLILKVLPTKAKIFGVSYLTSGLNWKANYTIELYRDYLNFKCWAEINNISGIDFYEANLNLVSGDIKRVQEISPQPYYKDSVSLKASTANNFTQESLAEYYIYNYEMPVNIIDNSSKQVKLLSSNNVKYLKYYTNPNNGNALSTVIEFKNSKENNLGKPLPQGVAKVYQNKQNEQGLQFIGEDKLKSTPANEKVTLNLGEPFDIIFEKNQIDFKSVEGFEQYEYEIIVRNNGRDKALLKITHFIVGDWKVVSSTEEYIKKDANTIEFDIMVQPNSEKRVIFKYVVVVRENNRSGIY